MLMGNDQLEKPAEEWQTISRRKKGQIEDKIFIQLSSNNDYESEGWYKHFSMLQNTRM